MFAFYLRGAIRSLRRTPVLSTVMVVDLALGLAIWVLAFTAVDSHTRDPITRKADLFHVDWGSAPEADLGTADAFRRLLAYAPHMVLSYDDAERLSRHPAVARRAKTFTSRIALSSGGGRIDSPVRFATRELFPMFELGFRFGGPWSEAAERDREPVVVLDHGSNERLFGGRDSVGRSLAIDGRAFRVAGVLAAAPERLRAFDFAIVNVPAVYLPFELYRELGALPDYVGARSVPAGHSQELERSADSFVQLWVELPGAGAQREYDAFIAAQAAQRRPHYTQRRPPVQSAASFIDESVPIGSGFLVFEVCAFVALLACCVNLSRLLIVKFQARAPELAVQRAFGATRGSVLAQYMIEVVLVTFAATALGLLIAYASLESINAIVPDRPSEFAIDPMGVLLACAVGLGSGILAGINPAIRSGQTAPAVFFEGAMSRVGATQILSSMRHRKAAYASLVLEVALGCTVAAYSVGLSRGIHQIAQGSLGFDVHRSFSVVFDRANDGYHERRTEEELAQLRALPGVQSAAFTEMPPLSRCELPETLMTPVGPRLAYSLRGDAELASALGVAPRIGRALRAGDVNTGGPTPVLITEAFARTLGPRPLGANLSSPGLGSLTVVGVVDDPLRLGPFFSGAQPLLIVPRARLSARRNTYIVQTTAAASSADFARVAAAELRARDPDRYVAVEQLAATAEHIQRNVGGADIIIFITVLGMALVVLVGSLGMASSLVVERARQIGIRRALGARRADILGYFMLENLIATLLGLLLSVGLCELLDRALGSLRGELVILWPEYILPAAALFLLSGQLAVLVPARRAAQIEPSVASRAA